jgi:hypothetical protein
MPDDFSNLHLSYQSAGAPLSRTKLSRSELLGMENTSIQLASLHIGDALRPAVRGIVCESAVNPPVSADFRAGVLTPIGLPRACQRQPDFPCRHGVWSFDAVRAVRQVGPIR